MPIQPNRQFHAWIQCISLWLLGIHLLSAASLSEHVVPLSATVQRSPPQITLTWTPDSQTSYGYQVYRKSLTATTWGSALATLPFSAVSWTDSTVSLGTAYEYRVTHFGTGYIASGIDLPVVEGRGSVVLLIDSRFSHSLEMEIAQLVRDLHGEGWQVIQHEVAVTMTAPSIKALVTADYLAAPSTVKAVILLGHVPVPYSGNIVPDGHSGHIGAWPADGYYGDMNGIWTDTTVNNSTSDLEPNRNIPGDGKFDQNTIPGTEMLTVGRIDCFDMPAFALSETELLRQYLVRAHHWRMGTVIVPSRALVDDNFGGLGGEAFAQNGWRTASLVGPGNVSAQDWFSTLATNSYLWAYGCGAGSYTSASGVGSTTDFAAAPSNAVFTMLFGSYHGDWDSRNNFLRAPLAASGLGLTCVWAGRPHWAFHRMGIGMSIGDSHVRTQMGRYTTYTPAGSNAGGVHMGLMGDPTLRMHPIQAPGPVTATIATTAVALTWSASPDAGHGYHVWRSINSGSEVRLTTNPILATAYTDSGLIPGTYTYHVRALRLEVRPSGTWINDSTAHSITVAVTGSAAAPEIQVVHGVKGINHAGTDNIGSLPLGTSSTATWTIANIGAGVLALGNAAITNQVNCSTTITTSNATSIGSGSSTPLGITITPGPVGTWSFSVSLPSNDSDESLLQWTVTGRVTQPVVKVMRDVTTIPNGATDAVPGTTAGVLGNIRYTLRNNGDAPLTFGTWTASTVVNCAVTFGTSITTLPCLTSNVFIINIRPTAPGNWSVIFSCPSNDAAANPVTWRMSGSAAAAPEIACSRAGVQINNLGTDTVIGSVSAQNSSLYYALANLGTSTLNISSVSVGSPVNCTAVVPAAPIGTVGASSSVPVNLIITPGAMGTWSCIVSIANDDSDENPLNWTVTGTATAAPTPEIEIRNVTTLFTDGGTHTVNNNVASIAQLLTYNVQNIGSDTLTTSNIGIGATNNCTITIVTQPPSLIPAGGSATWSVSMLTQSPGIFSAVISIPNNDSNEGPFDLTISGTAAGVVEMDVQRGGLSISDGANISVSGTSAGTPASADVVIINKGSANLLLGTAALSGLINCSATVSVPNPLLLSGGASAPLAISVTPTASGSWSCTVSMTSNDTNENPYNWTLNGTAAATPLPELDVTRAGIAIADNTTDAIHGIGVATATAISYSIVNSGSATLVLSGATALTSLVNCSATVTTIPAAAIPSGSVTTLGLVITPAASGLWTCIVTMVSNDPNEATYNWTLQGTTAAPDISLSRTRILADGMSDVIGGSGAGVTMPLTYTISNLGSSTLNVVNPTVTSFVNCTAAILMQPSSTLDVGTNTEFQTTVTPTAAGAWSCIMSVGSNDADENPFDIAISGNSAATLAPEIQISRLGTTITDGGSDAVSGSAPGAPVSLTYQITNLGSATLNIGTPIQLSGLTNCTVTLAATPSAVLLPAGITNLGYSVIPALSGAWSFQIAIMSNDTDESPSNWTISGNAGGASLPELNVSRNAVAINDGGSDTGPDLTNGIATALTYTLTNVGTAQLTITGSGSITGQINCTASVTTTPSATVAAGAATSLGITITPTIVGTWSFLVSVANNDSDESPYNWTVSGTSSPAPAPECDVTRNATAVVDGGTDPVATSTASTPSTLTYAIGNSGNAALTVTGAPAISGQINCSVSVSVAPASVIAASTTSNLVLTITPLAVGSWSCVVSLVTNDSNENPYNWSVSGTASSIPAPELDMHRGVTPITNNTIDTISVIPVGSANSLTYALSNNGSAVLTISSMPSIAGQSNCTASVTNMPAAIIAASSSESLTLAVTPIAPGPWSCVITLISNDADESPYGWTMSGTAQDMTPPATPAAPTVTGDGTPSPSLSGITEPDATVTVLVDGGAFRSITADASGLWTVPTSSLSPGIYSVQVTATDPAGNVSGLSTAVTCTVTGAPASPPVTNGGGGGGGGCGAGALLGLLFAGCLVSGSRRTNPETRRQLPGPRP